MALSFLSVVQYVKGSKVPFGTFYRSFSVREESVLIFFELAERYFRVDLHSRDEANSGLFARTERVKMPKRASDNPKSKQENKLAVKSKLNLLIFAMT